MEVDTDFTGGTLRQTKIDTDFAVNGEGFFQVRTPEGETLLSRAGNFLVNAQGQLVTQAGQYAVLDQSGGEIRIAGDQPWELIAGGIISQDGQNTAIGLQSPQSLGDLVKVGSKYVPFVGYSHACARSRAQYSSRVSRTIERQHDQRNDGHDRNLTGF